MNICIFEDELVRYLDPMVLTRPVYDLRIGLRTRCEELFRDFEANNRFLHCRPFLSEWTAREYDALVNRIPAGIGMLFVNGRAILDDREVAIIRDVAVGTDSGRIFMQDDVLVAAWIPSTGEFELPDTVGATTFSGLPVDEMTGVRFLERPWNLIDDLPADLTRAFARETKGYNIFERPGSSISEYAHLVNGEQIFVGKETNIHAGAILNAENGPIFIADGVTVFENAVVRGPAIIGRGSQIRVGANIKNVSIGPVCKVGGEVHDSVIHSYSSKVHDGFLGHSYVGRWCNLGAGTSNSNLRNDYGEVPLYNRHDDFFEPSGRQFLGLIMGDHSKCSIGTIFNTGTVIGVSCNLYGSGFHPRFVPSFLWGTPPDDYREYRLDKAQEVATAVMARRNIDASAIDSDILQHAHSETAAVRQSGIRR